MLGLNIVEAEGVIGNILREYLLHFGVIFDEMLSVLLDSFI